MYPADLVHGWLDFGALEENFKVGNIEVADTNIPGRR